MIINSREDLNKIKNTPEYEKFMRSLYGTLIIWSFNGEWEAKENLNEIEKYGFTKEEFLQEISSFNFPEHTAPKIPTQMTPEDQNPLEQTITKRQITAALIISGKAIDPDAFINSILLNIIDPENENTIITYRLALNDWNNAPYYERSYPLFNNENLLASVNLTSNDIDELWALAVTLPK